MHRLVLFVVAVSLTSSALAAVNASYTYVEPTSSDPGNELIRREVALDFSQELYQSEDKKKSYSAGLTLLDTRLDFDEPLLGKVELLKVKAPVMGLNTFSEKHSLLWNVTPGMHGEKDNFGRARFRVEGQAAAFYHVGKMRYVYGAGFGDQFGKLRPYPLFGTIWQASEKSQLTLMFPLLKYEYTTESTKKFNFVVQPTGAQWTWKPKGTGVSEPGNVIVKGTLFALGADFPATKSLRATASLGLIVNRRFEVANQKDSSRHAGVNLKNAWVAQAGISF